MSDKKETTADLNPENGVVKIMPVKKDIASNSNNNKSSVAPVNPGAMSRTGSPDPESRKPESQCDLELQKQGIGANCSPRKLFKEFRARRIAQKLVFVFSVVTLLFISVTLVYEPWLLLYFYTGLYPVLMLVRIIMYTKLKWQYYMLDLCYFVNWALLIYIWACPDQQRYRAILFSFANGPVTLAIFLFRNSLVLHSTDKMTSCALHVMPILLTHVCRWYPERLTDHWYTGFSEHNNSSDIIYIAVWLWAVPFAFYLFHMLIYLFLLKVVFRPSDEHDYSYKYLAGERATDESGNSLTSKMINCFGPNRKRLAYCMLTLLYGFLGFAYTPLLYHFYIANVVFLGVVLTAVTYNGATYYVEVFGPKNFV